MHKLQKYMKPVSWVVIMAMVSSFLSGCALAVVPWPVMDKAVPNERIPGITNIAIVPWESIPLTLPNYTLLTHFPAESLRAIGTAENLAMVPEPHIPPGTRALVLISGIPALISIRPRTETLVWISSLLEGEETARERYVAITKNKERYAEMRKNPVSIETALYDENSWVGSMVIAKEAANQIKALSAKEGFVIEKTARMLGTDRRFINIHIKDGIFNVPNMAWYGSDRARFDYTNLAKEKNVDVVLEIAFNVCSVAFGYLILEIMAKVVDAKSGQVLGRAREDSWTDIDSVDSLFEVEGQVYKDLFAKETKPLVTKVLENLGFIR